MRTFSIAVLVLAFGTTAEAGWFHKKDTPTPQLGGTAGRGSFAGIPGLGPPLPPSPVPRGMNPVVGSVQRTGIFAHPFTGRTRYTGTAYNPSLGQFGSYRFKK
jgi:hypothetical protein